MIKYKKPILIANWKMNHNFESAEIWIDSFFRHFLENRHNFKQITVVVCPPATLLDYIDGEIIDETIEEVDRVSKERNLAVSKLDEDSINRIIYEEKLLRLGSQNCHYQLSGSFTGDISLVNLQEVGCEFVIIGHSEVRQYHNEDDDIIAKKLEAVVSQEMVPIVCIGENLETRNSNQHQQFIAKQINNVFANKNLKTKVIIAYEPIWAIGSGKLPTALEIGEIANLIHKEINELKTLEKVNQDLDFSVVYGGSVNSSNSQEILEINNIDGLLIGKSSLDAEEFIQICNNIPKNLR
jgi:triosephosphate isomerase